MLKGLTQPGLSVAIEIWKIRKVLPWAEGKPGGSGMSFLDANHAYEKWLKTQCKVVEADLKYKHERMRKDAFVFLRATYFRWAGQIEKICGKAFADAPEVLSVGDVHIENFGTWRDAEGRLVWGINDFDEAADIPYPFDLVRLATSALLVPGSSLPPRDVARAIAEGYNCGLMAPRPSLLDEQQSAVRKLVADLHGNAEKFWDEVKGYPNATPCSEVADGLRRSLPAGATVLRLATRRKGGGSLGRPRYVAIANWRGGHVLREAKALVPSAWEWAHGTIRGYSRFLDLTHGMFRAPDPFLDVRDKFIFRRIAVDSRKVELGDDALVSMELLGAMGFDIGAIHAADRRCGEVRQHMAELRSDWLHDAATAAKEAVQGDFAKWKSKGG